VFNAANESAVELFLEGKVGFTDIPRAISSALERLGSGEGATREELLAADAEARAHVKGFFSC
jgi:1-deoxy-D-xylulose-5-phosphate reductoisomerase